MKKLIKNGTVVFEHEEKKVDLLIDGEKISAILAPGSYEGEAEIIDAEGLYVMPGTIDPHMHLGLYKPLGDAFRYDTPRQAVGGLTTLINYHRGKGNYFETVREAIDFACKMFGIPSCDIKLPKDLGRRRACINSQIG
ncbi:MAG: amidohydrolase family protein, partial [Clostridia bacterium]|nr:amidohydrolase family protein [Clostridia bacterium]